MYDDRDLCTTPISSLRCATGFPGSPARGIDRISHCKAMGGTIPPTELFHMLILADQILIMAKPGILRVQLVYGVRSMQTEPSADHSSGGKELFRPPDLSWACQEYSS